MDCKRRLSLDSRRLQADVLLIAFASGSNCWEECRLGWPWGLQRRSEQSCVICTFIHVMCVGIGLRTPQRFVVGSVPKVATRWALALSITRHISSTPQWARCSAMKRQRATTDSPRRC